ncbi:MAG: type II secretion system protein GspC [Polyangia bacterium]
MDLLLRRYFWVVNLTVIGLCAALVGRAASHQFEGAYLNGDDGRAPTTRRPSMNGVPKPHTRDVEALVKRDPFCSSCTVVIAKESSDKSGTPSSNEPQKTTLQLELVSTMIVADDDAWSMAVLRDLSTKHLDAEMFNRGKKIFATNAVVKSVLPRRVYLDNDGKTEYLDLDADQKAAPAAAAVVSAPSPPGELGDIDKSIQCNGTNCTIERALVDRALANTAALASMARFVPSVRDGKPNGFKVYAIRPNSLFGKLGMQNGDTLKQINGNEMATPDQALGLYTKLRSASHLSLQVERRGETVNMDYTIK